jgi:hypothetical protein
MIAVTPSNNVGCFPRKCNESDLDDLIAMVNDTYEVETGDSGIGFKCVKRLTSKDYARTYLEDLWVLREESGEVVGCVFAKVIHKTAQQTVSSYKKTLTNTL